MRITNCRSCGREDLRVILDLGSQPIANALLSAEELDRFEAKFDLAVAFLPRMRATSSDRDRSCRCSLMFFIDLIIRTFPHLHLRC